MKKGSTIFLRAVIVLIGVVAVVVMIRFPMTEGRAVNLDLLSIYSDPFIIYGYLASIPFFIALYQGYKLLVNIGENNVFSPSSIKALKNIKYSGIIQSVLIVLAGVYIRIFHAEGDDPAGFIAICIVAILISIIVAVSAAVFEKTVQSAVDLKTENNLTV